jgi:hypothetical protein
MATGTRLSFDRTTDVLGTEMRYTRTSPTYATMYSAMPALLVVSTSISPSGFVVALVPPTMLRMRPIVISSCRTRKCMTAKLGLVFVLMLSTLKLYEQS